MNERDGTSEQDRPQVALLKLSYMSTPGTRATECHPEPQNVTHNFVGFALLAVVAFKLWCYRRLLRVPWTARRSNQSILKEISPEYSLEGLMLRLKLQYFGHLMEKTDSLEKTLMLIKILRPRFFHKHHN